MLEVMKMHREGFSFGPLEYKTSHIPTMGASNSDPHVDPILKIEIFIDKKLNKKRSLLNFF